MNIGNGHPFPQGSFQPIGKKTLRVWRDCSICMRFGPAITIVTTQCGHEFCDECLHRWLDTRDTCPYCRSVLVGNVPQIVPQIVPQQLALAAQVHAFIAAVPDQQPDDDSSVEIMSDLDSSIEIISENL